MAPTRGETEFEFVGSWEGPKGSTGRDEAVTAKARAASQEAIPHAQVEALNQGQAVDAKQVSKDGFRDDRFPLAGPILDAAEHELKGRCSGCDSRLRIQVESKGPVKIRCPICGRTKQITV